MNRLVGLFVLCGAISLFLSGHGRTANDGAFQISDWVGRAHLSQKDKRLDRCSAQLTNPDKISMIYSLDRHFIWTFELTNPSWNFPKGAIFEVSFGTGNRNYFRQRVTAITPQLVRVQLPDTLTAFEAFRRMIRLELVAGGLTSSFDMGLTNQVLTELTRCVTRYRATPKTRAAVAAWLKSPIGPASRRGTNPEAQKEATALATSIAAEAQIAKATGLKSDEVPSGTSGDAFWKFGDNFFTVSIMPKDKAPEIGDLTDLIIGADAQRCQGDFFSGAALDVIDTVGVARAYTNCQTQQATVSTYYFAIPRKQGGLYLLTTIATGVEVTPTSERNAKDIDGKVRATIMDALSKM